jgi:hypothetical protein
MRSVSQEKVSTRRAEREEDGVQTAAGAKRKREEVGPCAAERGAAAGKSKSPVETGASSPAKAVRY